MHRQFFRTLAKNNDYIQNFATIEKIFFILHVDNGIHITIHNVIWYNNTYSHSNKKILILKFVRINLIFGIIIQILFCKFLENGNRYKVEIFSVNFFLVGYRMICHTLF